MFTDEDIAFLINVGQISEAPTQETKAKETTTATNEE